MPISLRQLAEKTADIEFLYLDQPVHVEYRVDRITKEFHAEAMRMGRQAAKTQRRVERLMAAVMSMEAADNTDAAVAEDAAAEAAILQIRVEEDTLKHQFDATIASIVTKWDVLDDAGNMVPIARRVKDAVTGEIRLEPSEELFIVPFDFLTLVLNTILQESGVGESGEALGKGTLTNSPLPLKPKGRQGNSHRFPTGTATSKPAASARQ